MTIRGDSRIDVLLSVMNQADNSFIYRANIQTNAIVINQTNHNGYIDIKIGDKNILEFFTQERGLSNSRNMALSKSKAEICLICDDDITYVDNYEKIVINAFNRVKKADILIFDSVITNRDGSVSTKGFKKIKKVPSFKTYSSVLIAFRRKPVVDNGIKFNTMFGTGSGKYSMCEDSLFLRDCYRKGLKAYIYPEIIHYCQQVKSSWFTGYNEKYFFDIGAYLSKGFPKSKNLLKWYYPIRMYSLTNLKWNEIIKYINAGFEGYKQEKSYIEYFKI